MRKSSLPLFLVCLVPLGGCAYVPMLPAAVELVRELGPRGYAAEDFGAAASEACVARATRYGRATVTRVEPQSTTTMRVYGTIQDAYRTRNFVCDFRSSGIIASFNMS